MNSKKSRRRRQMKKKGRLIRVIDVWMMIVFCIMVIVYCFSLSLKVIKLEQQVIAFHEETLRSIRGLSIIIEDKAWLEEQQKQFELSRKRNCKEIVFHQIKGERKNGDSDYVYHQKAKEVNTGYDGVGNDPGD